MHRRALGKGVGVTAIVPGDKARARARAHALECVAIDRADLPAVASGGRYDALTRALGQGDTIPAVGGVIRPTQALEVAL